METLLMGSVILNIILIVLFFANSKRIENTVDEKFERIESLVLKIKPEKIHVETDTSPWSLTEKAPVEEDEALHEMWQALIKRGLIGDHADRIAHLFGFDDYNRAPLPDGRTVVWYGSSMPDHIRNLVNQPYIYREYLDDLVSS